MVTVKGAFISFLLLLSITAVHSQNFLRSSNQEDFSVETQLDDREFGLTRTEQISRDLPWQLPPFRFKVPDSALRNHLNKYLGKTPVKLKLTKAFSVTNAGFYAVGVLPNDKKLRVFWRRKLPSPSVDLMKASYEEAVRSRLESLEFEVVLPPIKKRDAAKLPSVVYRIPVASGSINLKSIVPRGLAQIRVKPDNTENESIDVGECYVGAAPMFNGLIDPSWAKGRSIFRRGCRKSGLL